MIGELVYLAEEQRLGLLENKMITPLHCGLPIEVLREVRVGDDVKEVWIPTRVEFSHEKDEWYLAELYKAGEIPNDLTIRI